MEIIIAFLFWILMTSNCLKLLSFFKEHNYSLFHKDAESTIFITNYQFVITSACLGLETQSEKNILGLYVLKSQVSGIQLT